MKNLEINTVWQKNLPEDIPDSLKNWLLHADSFMVRLQQYGVHNARIEVLEESWQEPFQDEKQLLGLQPSARALVREVLILSDNTIWMFARTVIPRTLLEGELAQLAHLKTKPIGSILFNDKNIKRGSFLFARLHEAMDLYHSVKKYIPEEERLVRRSLFSFKEKSLLLTEVFMPELTTL